MSDMSKKKPTVDLGYPTEARGRIPSFNSIEEEAAFWDTHDSTEFNEELRPVEFSVSLELSEKLTVRLEREDREKLAHRAQEMGVGPSTLVRMWVKERLRLNAS